MIWRPRIRRRSLIITGSVLVVLAAVFWFLLGSTAGARFVLAQAIKKVPAGVSVTIERVEGKLLGPLALHGIRVSNQLVEVIVNHVEIDWSPKRLFNKRLYIERVVVDGVDARAERTDGGSMIRTHARGVLLLLFAGSLAGSGVSSPGWMLSADARTVQVRSGYQLAPTRARSKPPRVRTSRGATVMSASVPVAAAVMPISGISSPTRRVATSSS